MKGPADETVGSRFQLDLLKQARDKTLEVIREASQQVHAGMTEAEAKTLIQEIQTRTGAPKSWHPPQIRFGANTLLGFGEKGEENSVLKPDDIFFFDIGPIFDGHEGDVGRTFFIGEDPEMQRCCLDAEKILRDVRDHWQKIPVPASALYDFARDCAAKLGWQLVVDHASGHRISDFPHAARGRGSIEGLLKLQQAIVGFRNSNQASSFANRRILTKTY